MRRKQLALVFFIVGISLMVYPLLRDYYKDFQQRKLVSQWQGSLYDIDNEAADNEAADNDAADNGKGLDKPGLREELKKIEGILIIDKINLKVPIISGATEHNLNLGVASIDNTSKPGEVGCFCLAGHRSHSYGVLFNRLNELKSGDRVVVETKAATYVYRVTGSVLVEPADIQFLKGDGQRKQITLVTCDYGSKPYRRLIVQGELYSS